MAFTLDLCGRLALVTGAGQGVGRAIASSLAAAGATVAVNDVVEARVSGVVDEIRSAGGVAVPAVFDVTSWDDVLQAVKELDDVRILVNNAGGAGAHGWDGIAPFVETDPADWERFLTLNLRSVMLCTRAVLPGMIEAREGRIVTIISDAARTGEPNLAPYAAAKAGAAGFSRAIAREVGRHEITVNCVSLATVRTPGTDAVRPDANPDGLKKQLSRYMIRRLGEPDDVAGLVTYLASPHASWITGQTYPVNGGYSVTS